MTICPTRSRSESEPSVLSIQRCWAAVNGFEASNGGTDVTDDATDAVSDGERNEAQAAPPQTTSERMIRSFMSGRISLVPSKLYRGPAVTWEAPDRPAHRLSNYRRTMVR